MDLVCVVTVINVNVDHLGVVLPRFGSVRFFAHFGRTMNLTNGSVQANLMNPKPDLWFSSQGGPVLV